MDYYQELLRQAVRTPKAIIAALSVVAVFALAVFVSPVAAAVLVAPLAVAAAIAATGGDATTQSDLTVRASMSAGLGQHMRNRRRLSILDPQTGLLQPWYFELRVADEARRCRRYGMGMSTLFIKIEDDETHAGDPDWSIEVQMDMVQVLARQVRAVDLAARTGEREFALCLPHTGSEGAMALAWRIWQNAGSYTLVIRKAVAPEQGLDYEALYGAAEAFTPAEPAATAADEPSGHQQLVQMLKSTPYGEVPVPDGEQVRNTKSRLRRAAKRAGVEVRIWEDNGVIRFERLAARRKRGAA